MIQMDADTHFSRSFIFWTRNYVTMCPCEIHVVSKNLSVCFNRKILLYQLQQFPSKKTVFRNWCKTGPVSLFSASDLRKLWKSLRLRPTASWSSHPGKWTFTTNMCRMSLWKKWGVRSSKCGSVTKGRSVAANRLKFLCSCRTSTSSVRMWKCSETTRYHALQYGFVSPTLQ